MCKRSAGSSAGRGSTAGAGHARPSRPAWFPPPLSWSRRCERSQQQTAPVYRAQPADGLRPRQARPRIATRSQTAHLVTVADHRQPVRRQHRALEPQSAPRPAAPHRDGRAGASVLAPCAMPVRAAVGVVTCGRSLYLTTRYCHKRSITPPWSATTSYISPNPRRTERSEPARAAQPRQVSERRIPIPQFAVGIASLRLIDSLDSGVFAGRCV